MIDATLSRLDIAIVGGYFLAIVLIGVYVGRRHAGAEDYFLAGRSMTWPFIGLSLYASNMSSTTLVGLAGEAYSTGIAVYNYEWTAALVLAVYAWFVLPSVLRAQVYTMPEWLERRYDRRSRSYFSVLTLFLNIVVDTAGTLFAGALLVQLVFPDVPIWQSITAIALLAGIYTAIGGLTAVIVTDVMQAVILTLGATIVTVAALDKAGGWAAVRDAVPADMLSVIRPIDDASVPWPGLLTGLMIIGFYFWCTNQFMVQRVLSAKNLDHGRRGALFAGALKLPVLFIMVLPGTIAILLYPELPRADLVFPTLVFDLLPAGILGLVLAGFMAALMSQVDSTLNSASTLFTMDFVHKYRPGLSSRQLMRTGQAATVGFMLLAAAWAPQIAEFPSLFQYLISILAYAVPPVVVLFVFGLFWSGANATGSVAAIVVGALAGGALFWLNEVAQLTDVHFLHAAPMVFALSAAALIVASLVTRTNLNPAQRALLWSRREFRQESGELRQLPWYRNYRWLTALLLAASFWIVAAFW